MHIISEIINKDNKYKSLTVMADGRSEATVLDSLTRSVEISVAGVFFKFFLNVGTGILE